jgi:opacity protein-like surface antigen
MKKITCVLAIFAAALTAAVAKDLKQDKKATAPTVAAAQMTDSEMDRVTAGEGFGVGTAFDHNGGRQNWTFGLSTATVHSGDNPGHGVCTTAQSAFC